MKITLKAARVNIGMTLKEAAALFEINRETLSNYESDSTNVPRTFFIRIESVYGIPVEYIYFGNQQNYQAAMRDELLQEHA
jgi:transcriptional regulator with XRE-family HTH domain